MKTTVAQSLLEELPPPLRLAALYAPEPERTLWIALLALDRRLARAALGGGEPLLGQIKLAWWRDRFAEPASAWPEGEPLLAALGAFDADRAVLADLVDAWEGVGAGPDVAAREGLVTARVGAVLALARLARHDAPAEAVAALARDWARDDLHRRVAPDEPPPSHPAVPGISRRLPRELRPLAIMARASRADRAGGFRLLLAIMRLGLFGR